MPQTLDKFLLQLAEKAGIQPTNQKLVDLLGNTELNRINIPDELTTVLGSSLISIDEAKNNHPAIKTHYFAEVMSNVDRVLGQIYSDYEFSDEEKTELNAERSSTKRIALVMKKLKEKGDAAVAAAGGKKDPATQQHLQTINDLNGQLAALKTEMTTLKTSHQTALNDMKREQALESRFGGLKTVFDKLPGDVRTMSIRQLLTKELQDNGIKLILDENGGLKLQKEDGSNYFDENNRQVSVDDFIQKSLTKHKVFLNSPAPAKGKPNNGEQNEEEVPSNTEIITGKPNKEGNYSLKGLMDETLTSLKNENPVSIANPGQ